MRHSVLFALLVLRSEDEMDGVNGGGVVVDSFNQIFDSCVSNLRAPSRGVDTQIVNSGLPTKVKINSVKSAKMLDSFSNIFGSCVSNL